VSNPQASTGSQTVPNRWIGGLGEIFAGLVIIIASIYVIAPTYAELPLVTAAYGVALGGIARHMWKHGSPRSLRWLCVVFGVAAVALAVLAFVT
jgi:hypothetical protein